VRTLQRAGAASLTLIALAAPVEAQPRRPSTNGPAPLSRPQPVRALVHYRNCAEARAAGAAPLYQGQPGYSPHLDRDNDGVACEPYRGRR
jgi:hypothetical protein